MLKYIKVGYPKKAAEEFDRWVYAKKKKLPGLIRRRAAEKKLFLRKGIPVRKIYKIACNNPNRSFK